MGCRKHCHEYEGLAARRNNIVKLLGIAENMVRKHDCRCRIILEIISCKISYWRDIVLGKVSKGKR